MQLHPPGRYSPALADRPVVWRHLLRVIQNFTMRRWFEEINITLIDRIEFRPTPLRGGNPLKTT